MNLKHEIARTLIAVVGGMQAFPNCAEGAVTQEGQVLVIEAVAVVSVGEGDVVPDQTVTIQRGVISRIERAGLSPVPDGATVVDGRGRYLSPGFADMHVHPWGQASFDLLLALGITSARDMAGSPWYLGARTQIAMGLRRGPRLTVASPILEGTPSPDLADVIITEGRIIVDDSASAADSVRSFVEQGYDAIKVYNNLNASAYSGITTEAARLGVPVVGHVPIAVGLEGAFEAGQRTIEHLRGYVLESVPPSAPDQPAADYRSRLVSWRHADTTQLRTLARRTAALGIWNTPTLGFLADLLPAGRISEVTARPGWQRCMKGRYADPIASRERVPYFAVMTDDDFAATQEGVVVQKRLVLMLHQEGAGLLVGTDRLPWGFSYHWELEELADAGLAPETILRAATLDAAVYLGQDDVAGSVEVGKRADLVLLNANPLEDVRNARRIEAVIVNGVLLDSSQLEAMIESGCRALAEVG